MSRVRSSRCRMVLGSLFVAALVTGSASAAGEPVVAGPDQERNQERDIREGEALQPRIPPAAARSACAGKHEGDSCSFIMGQVSMTGECLSGREQVFACRPHRGGTPRESVASPPPLPPAHSSQEQRPARQASPRKETTPETAAHPVPVKGAEQRNDTSIGQHPVTLPPSSQQESPRTDTQEGQRQPEALPPNPDAARSNPDSFAATIRRHADAVIVGLAVAVGSAVLAWFVCFRSTTAPLRRLRKVTRQLAEGKLSARVGEGLIHRKSEVVDLGRDVDLMAERIETLMGAQQRLIRDVSHELRSPLARLNVALELARQSTGPEHAAPFDRIERESNRLNELIGQLLMLTRLESDSVMTRKSPVNLGELLTDIVHDVDFEAGSNGRGVTLSMGEPLTVNGNPELLRQALENLVRNAARYTESGTAVEVSLSRRETGGRVLAHVEVRDHGPGVPDGELKDIFRPFYRVNAARDRQSGGAGVGLAISERAIRLHEGTISAANASGGGLLVMIDLPLV